jgi:hypothetical protein
MRAPSTAPGLLASADTKNPCFFPPVYGQDDFIRQLITALFVARNEIELQVKWHLIPSHPVSWPQFYFIFQKIIFARRLCIA